MGGICSATGGNFHVKYRQGDLLGKGSQGKVYLCIDRETSEKYAVKVIDRSAKSAFSTYRREVDLCRACDASNQIVRVVDEFIDSMHCYVVMEKYACHLRKALKWVGKENGNAIASNLSNAGLRRILVQTVEAVAHLHNLDIVHRDVKAQNFLVDRLDLRDETCRVVLSDFGLARRLEPGHILNAQVGTRKYWPPELYEKKYWNVVDNFALGVLLFLAASGTYPYMDEDAVHNRDIFAEGAVPECLTPEAQDFMRCCLVKDPTQRIKAAELREHSWIASFINTKHTGTLDIEDVSTTVRTDLDSEVYSVPSPAFAHFGGKLGKVVAHPIPVLHGDIVEMVGSFMEIGDMSEDKGAKGDQDEEVDEESFQTEGGSDTNCSNVEGAPSFCNHGLDATPSTAASSGWSPQNCSLGMLPPRRGSKRGRTATGSSCGPSDGELYVSVGQAVLQDVKPLPAIVDEADRAVQSLSFGEVYAKQEPNLGSGCGCNHSRSPKVTVVSSAPQFYLENFEAVEDDASLWHYSS